MPNERQTAPFDPEVVLGDYLSELIPQVKVKPKNQEPPAPAKPSISPEPAKKERTQPHLTSVAGGTVENHVSADATCNSSPDWAQDPFDSLIFNVAGLKLAVPLVNLGSVISLNSGLKSVPGMPDWFLGLYRNERTTVNVVDTALWIMPQRYKPGWRDTIRFMVGLNDSNWALACSAIGNVCALNPDHIKWRTRRSQRPWIAGTLVDQLCVLIDTAGLLGQLGNNEQKKT